MGSHEERVPMESVQDLEGTVPPSETIAGQPETIQEEKEEEVPVTARIEMEGDEEEEGGPHEDGMSEMEEGAPGAEEGEGAVPAGAN